jgi:hypothetical protein
MKHQFVALAQSSCPRTDICEQRQLHHHRVFLELQAQLDYARSEEARPSLAGHLLQRSQAERAAE